MLILIHITELKEPSRTVSEGKLLDIVGMEEAFSTFVSDFQNSLEANHINPFTIVQDLLMVKAVTKQFQPSKTVVPELLYHTRKDLMAAKSINEVIRQISPFVSFFNYSLIEVVVHKHGSSVDRKNFKDYLNKLEEFCRCKTTEVPSVLASQDPMSTLFKVKLGSDFQGQVYTVKAVNLFRIKLCKILHITEPSLRLFSLHGGHILLTFLLPNFIISCVFPLTQDQERALSGEGVKKYALADESYQLIDGSRTMIR